MMSLLSFITEWATHAILAVGILLVIAGFVLDFIPFVKSYQLACQVIGIIMLGFGLYSEGKLAESQSWEAKVKDLEVKLADAEVRAANVNTEIVTQTVTKKQIIKEKGEDVIKYIDREVVKYDNNCPIPQSAIKAHNAAAQNKKVDEDVIVTPDTTIPTQHHNAAAKQPIKLTK
jgi:hypothetical protein